MCIRDRTRSILTLHRHPPARPPPKRAQRACSRCPATPVHWRSGPAAPLPPRTEDAAAPRAAAGRLDAPTRQSSLAAGSRDRHTRLWRGGRTRCSAHRTTGTRDHQPRPAARGSYAPSCSSLALSRRASSSRKAAKCEVASGCTAWHDQHARRFRQFRFPHGHIHAGALLHGRNSSAMGTSAGRLSAAIWGFPSRRWEFAPARGA